MKDFDGIILPYQCILIASSQKALLRHINAFDAYPKLNVHEFLTNEGS